MFKNSHLYFTLLLILVFILVPTQSVPESALITQIPGFSGAFPTKHYSGYVTIDEVHGKKLYYYFVESERTPSKDPVVLWLNGGPGCSSFDGFVYEHGPFNFEAGKPRGSLPTLHLNPYSWSKVSNILYLDSPAGVGLSYSGNKSDYITGDLKTASDSHTFLLKWFELYPEFLSNPFYIAGESYAGIYVPTLAYEVAKGIDTGTKPILKLKGYMVGNGVSDDVIDGNALVPFVHGMGLISNELFEEVNADCQGNYYDPMSDNCENKLAKVEKEIEDLNIYDILEPCYHDTQSKITLGNEKLPLSFRKLGETERPLRVRKRMFGRAWPLRAPVREGLVPTWPQLLNSESVPCTDDEVATSWLNNEAVRKAIHAENGNVIGNWELCTDKIRFYHDAGSMIKYHKNLTSRGYRALIYRLGKSLNPVIHFLPHRCNSQYAIAEVLIGLSINALVTKSKDVGLVIPFSTFTPSKEMVRLYSLVISLTIPLVESVPGCQELSTDMFEVSSSSSPNSFNKNWFRSAECVIELNEGTPPPIDVHFRTEKGKESSMCCTQ